MLCYFCYFCYFWVGYGVYIETIHGADSSLVHLPTVVLHCPTSRTQQGSAQWAAPWGGHRSRPKGSTQIPLLLFSQPCKLWLMGAFLQSAQEVLLRYTRVSILLHPSSFLQKDKYCWLHIVCFDQLTEETVWMVPNGSSIVSQLISDLWGQQFEVMWLLLA